MYATYLGEFEEIALPATGILNDAAYGVSTCNEIKNQSGLSVNIGAVRWQNAG